MSNSILQPTDFSDCANNALDFAIEVAKVLKCKINVVHCLDFTDGLDVSHNPVMVLAQTEKMEEVADEKMDALKAKVLSHNVECETFIYSGNIDAWLPKYISDHKPELVVMGTKGANTLSKQVFGSNTYSVIKNSSYPVLAIPQSVKLKKDFEHFVLSTAYRDEDIDAIEFLARLAKPSNAKINVVHVLNEHTAKRDNNQEVMDDLALRVKEKEDYSNIEYELLYSSDPENRLRILVEEKKPDMLSVIMRKQGFFERMFFGSLTENLVAKSHVPLLVFSAS